MINSETKCLKILAKAIDEIAAFNEYPPPPAQWLTIQREWRRMVTIARKAQAKAKLEF